MNCINHPDIPVSAYCQNCGKPLCKDCVRSVGGIIYCEPCLLARLGAQRASAADPLAAMGELVPPPHAANPALAGLLGIIPGVGAMYNGQFVKGLAHVFVFAVLVSLSHSAGIFGIFVAAWVVYQIFDAYHTAKARRDGLPLPDPFALNDIGQRLGLHPQPAAPAAGGPIPAASVPPQPGMPPYPGVPPQPGPAAYADPSTAAYGTSAAGFVPPTPPYTAYAPPAPDPATGAPYAAGAPPYSAPPPAPSYVPGAPYGPGVPYAGSGGSFSPGSFSNDLPVGAIILIGLGVLFLLGTLGIFSGDWIERGWPLLIIGLGIWLAFRRSRGVPPSGGPTPGGGR